MTDKLKEAIEVLKKVKHWIDYGAGELEPTANTVIEAIDTVVDHCEKPTYTPDDIQSFWRWAYNNGSYYGELTEGWYLCDQMDDKRTIEEVLKIWKETTG